MTNISGIAAAIGMIAGFLLFAGGVNLLCARQTRGRGVLMVVAGVVIIMNVMIWTL